MSNHTQNPEQLKKKQRTNQYTVKKRERSSRESKTDSNSDRIETHMAGSPFSLLLLLSLLFLVHLLTLTSKKFGSKIVRQNMRK